MSKSILSRTLMSVSILLSASLVAQEVTITWDASLQPGQIESFIQGDTTATGEQANTVYILEKGKIYLQKTEINLRKRHTMITIKGQEVTGDEVPATIQPHPLEDGTSGFTGWPNGNFQMQGRHAELHLENLILNGAMVDQSGCLGSVVTAREDHQKISFENVVTTHYVTFVGSTFGRWTDFHFNNSVATGFTNGPGGQFFGGLMWGGGSWMGTYDTLIVSNSTVQGVLGEGVVIHDQVGYGMINQCTFANITMGALFYRGQNNMQVKNNLFVNIRSHGMSTYDVSGWSTHHPGGHGVMSVLRDFTPPDSAQTANDHIFSMTDRNIHYFNNVATVTNELRDGLELYDTWSWDVSSITIDTTTTPPETTTTVTTVHDTMMAPEKMWMWMDDSTQLTLDQGVNFTATDNHWFEDPSALGFNLDPGYINAQINRTWDFRDDLQGNTAPFDGVWWQYEADGLHTSFQWPMHLDLSYDPTSAAATANEDGQAVGDPRWMGAYLNTDKGSNLPKEFTLKQNYPNPFNPTTDISFSLDKTSDINLTIFNLLGQKVRVLANGTKNAGYHTMTWNGQDDMGKAVSAGVYLYQLTNGKQTVTKKMALMK